MNTKEWIDKLNQDIPKEKLLEKHCQEIQMLTDRLIFNLYILKEDTEGGTPMFVRDPNRCKKFNVESDNEPINFGDLHCFEVYLKDDYFVVCVEEAAPNDCPTFCAYLEKYLGLYGYKVSVQTEW